MTEDFDKTSRGEVSSSEREQAHYRSYRNNSAQMRTRELLLGKRIPARDPGAFLARVDMKQFNDTRLEAIEQATLDMLMFR